MEAPRMARPMIVLMACPMVKHDTWIVGSSSDSSTDGSTDGKTTMTLGSLAHPINRLMMRT
jgi:hypothetical protein